MKKRITLAAAAAILAMHGLAQVPETPTPQSKVSLSVTYSALHTNAPVGECGCFWSEGGSAEVALSLWHAVSGVGELSGERANHIPGYGPIGLSLVSYMAGARVTRHVHTRYAPFAQSLVGGVHAFDSEFPRPDGLVGKATAFAMAAGGGLDIAVARHLLIRPIQVDYQYMQLPNSSTNQQHDIRLAAGFVLR